MSCNGLQTILGDESKQFQGSSSRMFLASFPLADQTGGHVQIARKHRLTGPFTPPKFANLLGA